MPARLRHFAICVSDIEAAAKFYQEVFGLERVGQETLSIGSGIYLSDGVVNLALLSGTVGTAVPAPMVRVFDPVPPGGLCAAAELCRPTKGML